MPDKNSRKNRALTSPYEYAYVYAIAFSAGRYLPGKVLRVVFLLQKPTGRLSYGHNVPAAYTPYKNRTILRRPPIYAAKPEFI